MKLRISSRRYTVMLSKRAKKRRCVRLVFLVVVMMLFGGKVYAFSPGSLSVTGTVTIGTLYDYRLEDAWFVPVPLPDEGDEVEDEIEIEEECEYAEECEIEEELEIEEESEIEEELEIEGENEIEEEFEIEGENEIEEELEPFSPNPQPAPPY